jgi:hypothetical protein
LNSNPSTYNRQLTYVSDAARFVDLTPEEVTEMGLTVSDEDYYDGRYWVE